MKEKIKTFIDIEKDVVSVLQNDPSEDAFEDFIKIVMVKYYDETFNLSQFNTTPEEEPELVKERILNMLYEAMGKLDLYPHVISDKKPNIKLLPSTVKELVMILQRITVSEIIFKVDFLGDIYMEL